MTNSNWAVADAEIWYTEGTDTSNLIICKVLKINGPLALIENHLEDPSKKWVKISDFSASVVAYQPSGSDTALQS